MNTNTINVKVKRNKMSLVLAFGAGAAVGAGGVLIAQKVQEKHMDRMLNLIIEDDIQSTVNEWNDMDDDEDVVEDDEDFEDEPIDQSKSSSDNENENLDDLDDERPGEPIEEELDERGEMTDVNIVHPESSDRSDVPEDSEDIPEDTVRDIVTIDVADVVVLSDRSSINEESTTVESSLVETTDGSESELVELKTTILNDETGDDIPAVSSSEEEVAVTVVEAEDETTSEGPKNGPSPEVVTKIQQMMENMNAIGSLLEEKRFVEAKQMYRIELLPITEDEFIKEHRPEIIPIISKIGDEIYDTIASHRKKTKGSQRNRRNRKKEGVE